ncbi:hypothetical protein CRUP_038557 [Coryphaenoides rupestris]|nr:hypothetical protein CRUP_038557 [Coryphaenoides rupestris]
MKDVPTAWWWWFNPDVPSHLKELETWHSMFISSQGLQDGQCLLIAHHKPGSGDSDERLPLGIDEPEEVRRAFHRYLGSIVTTLSESREREEIFESCWPALMKDSNGVVVVFNPDVPSHLKELETWHSMGLQDGQCLLIAHHKPGSGDSDERLPLGIDEPEEVRRAFHRYLGSIVTTLSESREREEISQEQRFFQMHFVHDTTALTALCGSTRIIAS